MTANESLAFLKRHQVDGKIYNVIANDNWVFFTVLHTNKIRESYIAYTLDINSDVICILQQGISDTTTKRHAVDMYFSKCKKYLYFCEGCETPEVEDVSPFNITIYQQYDKIWQQIGYLKHVDSDIEHTNGPSDNGYFYYMRDNEIFDEIVRTDLVTTQSLQSIQGLSYEIYSREQHGIHELYHSIVEIYDTDIYLFLYEHIYLKKRPTLKYIHIVDLTQFTIIRTFDEKCCRIITHNKKTILFVGDEVYTSDGSTYNPSEVQLLPSNKEYLVSYDNTILYYSNCISHDITDWKHSKYCQIFCDLMSPLLPPELAEIVYYYYIAIVSNFYDDYQSLLIDPRFYRYDDYQQRKPKYRAAHAIHFCYMCSEWNDKYFIT